MGNKMRMTTNIMAANSILSNTAARSEIHANLCCIVCNQIKVPLQHYCFLCKLLESE